jgi:hypothetical protein
LFSLSLTQDQPGISAGKTILGIERDESFKLNKEKIERNKKQQRRTEEQKKQTNHQLKVEK